MVMYAYNQEYNYKTLDNNCAAHDCNIVLDACQ